MPGSEKPTPLHRLFSDISPSKRPDASYYDLVETVATADPDDIQKVGAAQLALSTRYYESVLLQAKRSFTAAILSAIVGLVFFLISIGAVLAANSLSAATMAAIGGALVEVISGLNFWLYGRTASQLDVFHLRLDQMQRYLVANSLSTSLDDATRGAVIADLVRAVASPNTQHQNSTDADT
jgi:hypothetical protein